MYRSSDIDATSLNNLLDLISMFDWNNKHVRKRQRNNAIPVK